MAVETIGRPIRTVPFTPLLLALPGQKYSISRYFIGYRNHRATNQDSPLPPSSPVIELGTESAGPECTNIVGVYREHLARNHTYNANTV